MTSCICEKEINGYCKWKCVNLKCKQCKTSLSATLILMKMLKCTNLKKNKTKITCKKIEKFSEKVEEVEKRMMYVKLFTVHKYEVPLTITSKHPGLFRKSPTNVQV